LPIPWRFLLSPNGHMRLGTAPVSVPGGAKRSGFSFSYSSVPVAYENGLQMI
jgi:hypothetical protein